MYKSRALISFILCVAFIVGAVFWLRADSYTDAKDQTSCETGKKDQAAGTCGVWVGSNCFKGKCDDAACGSCIKKGDWGPMILLILGGISFIAFIVFLVISPTKSNSNFGFHEGSSCGSSE